jgi:hypothetical protein
MWFLEQVITLPTEAVMKENSPSGLNLYNTLTEQEIIKIELQEKEEFVDTRTEICNKNQLGRKELAVILSQYITAMLPNIEGLVLDETKISPTSIYHRSHPGLRPKVIEFSYCTPCSEKRNIPKKKMKKIALIINTPTCFKKISVYLTIMSMIYIVLLNS